MASLYDLELQESNNFIMSLVADGIPISLKLMEDQKSQFASMGAAGEEILKQMEDPTSDMGKNLVRLNQIKDSTQKYMKEVGMDASLAQKAQDILTKNPAGLSDLNDDDRSALRDYWIKKKTIISKMFNDGFTAEELFS